jgi:uncharacterized protein YndB with AHSA1/START domain
MDKIEKKVLLHAPLERVWQAISDAQQFGSWFGARFDGPFRAQSRLSGAITPTSVDPEVAKLQKPHEGKAFEFWVDRIEPMRYIAFRWHPFAIEPNIDYTKEPTTLIEFTLQAIGEATELTIVESGFENIPIARRADAFRANEGGWTHQMKLIERYLASRVPA